MKITDIEIIPIRAGLAARYAGREMWFPRIDHRTIYKVHTDNVSMKMTSRPLVSLLL